MAKLNHWRTNKIHGRKTLDHRFEFDPDYVDTAARWLRRAEQRNQAQRQQRQREYRSGSSSAAWITAPSSEASQ